MFNALFSEDAQTEKRTEQPSVSNAAEASSSSAASPILNFWSVAAAVTNTVKARADELVKSVVDTDWRTELSQFSREVGEESKTLKEKTAELVEHLPEQVVHLPEKAEEALQHLPAQVQLPKDVGQTLEGVGVAFAQFGKTLLQGTKELIDELKDGVETEMATASREGKRSGRTKSAASSSAKLASVTAKYNRFEAEVAAMQRDSSTYCDEPEDAEEYSRWKAGFSLDSVRGDITRILSDNAFMAELQSRLVPIIVEHDDFWHRYFYRLHKLQQKEEQRQQLAQRAKTLQEDDVPLGWGDEDEVPQSPLAGEAAGASAAVAAEPAAVSSPGVAADSKSVAAASASLPAADAQVPPAEVKPAAVYSARSEEPKQGADAAAVGALAAAAAAVVVGSPAAEPRGEAPETATSIAVEPEGVVDRKMQSGGGASTGSAGISSTTSVAADAGHLESEPHLETSSDSSAKEWCVVSSDAQQPARTAAAAAGPAADGGEEPARQPQAGQTGPAAAGTESATDAAAAASPASTPATVTDSTSTAAEVSAPAAEKSASETKARTGKGTEPGEEELDEDWGNWD